MQISLCTLRPAFWPDLNYFWRMYQCDLVLLTDHLLFIKQSEITVSAPFQEKKQKLRIPVKHTGCNQTIADKEMDTMHPWREQHLKALQRIFSDNPFTYLYLPQIQNLYTSTDDNLTEFLYRIIHRQAEWLHLKSRLLLSSRLTSNNDATAFVIEQCKSFGCGAYLAERRVYDRGWVNEKKLRRSGIEPIVFRPLPKANIIKTSGSFAALSFLMQYGPEAGYLLRQFEG